MSSTKKATTLFNLKDEYLKAKQEIDNSNQGSSNKKIKDIIQYKKVENDKKAAGKSAKQRKRDARLALTEREEEDLARSKSVLEAKSAVYDKLLNKVGDSSEHILVDFSQKRAEGHPTSYNTSPTIISRDEEEPTPDEVHFANVDHGEVRSKGVGFYNFSEDPETRKQQMEFLDSMRETTERSRELFLAAKNKRRQEKLDRLNRLRKRLGLVPLVCLPNEELEEVELEPYEEYKDEGVKEEGGTSNFIQPGTTNKEKPNLERSIEEKFLLREQSLWEKKVEDLRSEREMEFAPVYDTYNAFQSSGQKEIDEESYEIVNFISFVRRNT